VGGLTQPVAADQAVCPVGQTNAHSSTDHTTSLANIQWSSLAPQTTLLMPLRGLTGSVLTFCGLTVLAKTICKSRLGYL